MYPQRLLFTLCGIYKSMKIVTLNILVILFVILMFTNLQSKETNKEIENCLTKIGSQVWIESGTFTMGSEDFYSQERPIHEVTVDGFWIDTHEVTNQQFAKFIEDTAYVTVAERQPNPEDFPGTPPEMIKPGSAMFIPPTEGGRISSW